MVQYKLGIVEGYYLAGSHLVSVEIYVEIGTIDVYVNHKGIAVQIHTNFGSVIYTIYMHIYMHI